MIFALLISLVAAGATETRNCIVKCARNQIGKPYVWGAEGPNSFDCSGLVMYCYEKCGYSFDHRPTTYTLVEMGTAVSQNKLTKADLVLPNSGHVQIYSGNGKIIHAPQSNDVVKEVALYKFWKGRRLIKGSTSDSSSSGSSSSKTKTVNKSGYVTVTKKSLNVRSKAKTNASSVATYAKGEGFYYDRIIKNTQCTWLSYISYSGARRYVCGKSAKGKCYVKPCPSI